MTIIRTEAVIRLPMHIDHNAVHQRIKTLDTLQEKQDLVRKTNPYLYAFGERLLAQQHLSYADWLEKLYLGEV